MTGVITRLPVLILNVHSRCNCRCAMCDIWKTDSNREMPLSFVEHHIDSIAKLGTKWVVLSGGEPLMHSNLFHLCEILRSRGVRVTVLTSGLLIGRYARELSQYVDDLIVSIDGPAAIHDWIRGVKGAFELISAGLSKVTTPAACRCTVQKANHTVLCETIDASRSAGFHSISFLAADLTSRAFNRPAPWDSNRQNEIALSINETAALAGQIEQIIASADPFVRDSPDHLRRIVHHFEAHLGLSEPVAPRCNAPWVSAVIEPDGALRPCFFHPVVAHVGDRFDAAVNGRQAVAFRQSLDISANATCRNCVCSLNLGERSPQSGEVPQASSKLA